MELNNQPFETDIPRALAETDVSPVVLHANLNNPVEVNKTNRAASQAPEETKTAHPFTKKMLDYVYLDNPWQNQKK